MGCLKDLSCHYNCFHCVWEQVAKIPTYIGARTNSTFARRVNRDGDRDPSEMDVKNQIITSTSGLLYQKLYLDAKLKFAYVINNDQMLTLDVIAPPPPMGLLQFRKYPNIRNSNRKVIVSTSAWRIRIFPEYPRISIDKWIANFNFLTFSSSILAGIEGVKISRACLTTPRASTAWALSKLWKT